MLKSITHTLNLIVKECPVCCVVYAMPESLNTECQRTGRDFYCPNGHSLIFTTTENQKLKRQIQDLETQLSAKAQQARIEAEARQKTEKKLASIQKRTAAGVCPRCHRSFTALRRHMKNKHPEFAS